MNVWNTLIKIVILISLVIPSFQLITPTNFEALTCPHSWLGQVGYPKPKKPCILSDCALLGAWVHPVLQKQDQIWIITSVLLNLYYHDTLAIDTCTQRKGKGTCIISVGVKEKGILTMFTRNWDRRDVNVVDGTRLQSFKNNAAIASALTHIHLCSIHLEAYLHWKIVDDFQIIIKTITIPIITIQVQMSEMRKVTLTR